MKTSSARPRTRQKEERPGIEAGQQECDQRFLLACRGLPVDRVPVWLMRQAGRTLPEYRALRQDHDFLTVCKTPELAVEATLQPLQRFGFDAAILFSDILVLPEAMGAKLTFVPKVGPRFERAVRSRRDVQALCVPDPEERLGFVLEAVRLLKQSLSGTPPLIGFSGAPFTLAGYLIEGGSSRDLQTTKCFMYREPETFRRLMEKLARAVLRYLRAQIHAGVQAVQVFDTWAGVLSPGDYREFVLPHMQELMGSLNETGVPTIHYSQGTSTLLDDMAQTGARVLSLDWKIDIGEARERLGLLRPVQGNLDPLALFQHAGRLILSVREILEKAAGAPGFIFNLGHGLHPQTPLEHIEALLETVRSHPLPARPSASAPWIGPGGVRRPVAVTATGSIG